MSDQEKKILITLLCAELFQKKTITNLSVLKYINVLPILSYILANQSFLFFRLIYYLVMNFDKEI